MSMLILGMAFSFLISCYLSKQLNDSIFFKKKNKNKFVSLCQPKQASEFHMQNCVSHLESQVFPSVSYEMEYCCFRRRDFPTAFSVVQRG